MLRPLLRNDLQRCTKQGINGGAGSCNPCLRRFAGRQHIKEPSDRLQALAEALNLTPTAQTFTEALNLHVHRCGPSRHLNDIPYLQPGKMRFMLPYTSYKNR